MPHRFNRMNDKKIPVSKVIVKYQTNHVLWWWFVVFNVTFNNISIISWRSVLLVEETEVPGEKH
jgi:hypothetical protein